MELWTWTNSNHSLRFAVWPTRRQLQEFRFCCHMRSKASICCPVCADMHERSHTQPSNIILKYLLVLHHHICWYLNIITLLILVHRQTSGLGPKNWVSESLSFCFKLKRINALQTQTSNHCLSPSFLLVHHDQKGAPRILVIGRVSRPRHLHSLGSARRRNFAVQEGKFGYPKAVLGGHVVEVY